MMTQNVLTENFSEPLDGAMIAKVYINAGDGNLTIDWLTGGEQMLASGALQYLENQGPPTRTLVSRDGLPTLTLEGGIDRRPRFRLPWAACNGATEWQIHLNPTVSSDITAHSNGGNIKLDLAGMAVTCLSADTGGGNLDVVLPDNASDLSVTARTGGGNVTIEIGSGTTGSNLVNAHSGAGNVVVNIPDGFAARIHTSTGMGKTIIDPQFNQIDKNTYISPDFDTAANKVEITLHSGAGNVSVNTR
jgi:hypothetical protein